MDAKIDYLSFTFGKGLPAVTRKVEHHERELIWQAIMRQVIGHDLAPLFDQLSPAGGEWSHGRGHYSNRIYWSDRHVNLWFGGAGHLLVELAGVACQWLRDSDLLGYVVDVTSERVTRVDIACDFITRITPLEFVSAGVSARIKTRSQIVSSTGQTVYLGSPNSDRYCRVYQYNEPHPRAGMLRAEFVNRRTAARAVINALRTTSLRETGTMIGNSFGFEHWLWTQGLMTTDRMKVSRDMTHGGGTLIWFHKAVVPALQRLHREGVLSVDDAIKAIKEGLEG